MSIRSHSKPGALNMKASGTTKQRQISVLLLQDMPCWKLSCLHSTVCFLGVFLAGPLSKNAATVAAYLTWCQLVWSQL